MRFIMALYQPDHYRVLGVPVGADARRLKEAYHRLSRVYHPDLRGGSRLATERFQRIAAAYSELSDASLREIYDRKLVLMDPLRMVDDPRAERALDRIDGIVGRLRRRPKALPGRPRGRDLRVTCEVPLAVAALGGSWHVMVDYETTCATCDGVGTVQPDRNPGCHVCMGEGHLKVGVRRQRQVCGFCGGRGEVLLAPCDTCDGSGRVQDRREVAFNVPARLGAAATLRVRGAGEMAPRGGIPGDVIVATHIAKHPLLEPRGDDLICQLPLSWSEATCGCTRDVPTLAGLQRLRVPAGSWSGRELRVPQQGLLRRDQHRGDLRYVIMVDVPNAISEADGAALRSLESQLGIARFARRARYETQLDAVAAADRHDRAGERVRVAGREGDDSPPAEAADEAGRADVSPMPKGRAS